MLKGYTDAELVQDLRALVQVDADYKSGRIDARIAVEKLIVQFTAVG
jgi:DNA polymerase III delta subunit